jgi:SAM-dependent methyltransferase
MIRVWSHGRADDNMPEKALVSVYQKVQRHPWWHARVSLALALLRKFKVLPPARILDVGCGWGTNLTALEKCGYEVSGLDISRQVLDLIDRPNRDLIEADLKQDVPPGERGAYDGCFVLDVIEHLDDDQAALARVATLMRSGAIAVVSVPALPELFSHFDRVQGHRRRYVPQTLTAAFDSTGLEIQSLFWWGAWMVPVLRGMRLKDAKREQEERKTYGDYLRLPRWPGPQLMRLAFTLERPFSLNGWVPTGTSLFAVARRQNRAAV